MGVSGSFALAVRWRCPTAVRAPRRRQLPAEPPLADVEQRAGRAGTCRAARRNGLQGSLRLRERLGRAHRARHRAGRLAAGRRRAPAPPLRERGRRRCAANTLIVVNDRAEFDLGSILYVVDIANPHRAHAAAPSCRSAWTASTDRGSGHIANFVKTDCTQAWVDGGDHVEVVDLTVPTAPRSLGKFESAASTQRLQHHPRHRARQHRHALERRRRRRGRLPPDRQSARAPAARARPATAGSEPLALQRLHPPQLAAAREDAARHRGGLHRHRREVPPGGCRGQGKFETWDPRG